MISIVTGIPGTGKSYYLVRVIIDELLNGNKFVVTNLPIVPHKLHEYCVKRSPSFDINTRLRLLKPEEVSVFYLHRTQNVHADLRAPTRESSLAGVHVDYSNTSPVLFVIDEAQIQFDSREWTKTGPELTFYNSQHRKLLDDVYFATQDERLIETRIRSFAEQFIYCQNGVMDRLWTYFRQTAKFTVKSRRKPLVGGQNKDWNWTETYALDLEVASCYDTSAGTAIAGRLTHEKRKTRGLHYAWLVVPICAGAWVLVGLPDWAINKATGGHKPGAGAEGAPVRRDTEVPVAASRTSTPRQGVQGKASVTTNNVTAVQNQPPQQPAVIYVRFVAQAGRRINVLLEDGSILTERDLLQVTDRAVYHKDGRRFPRAIRGQPAGVAGRGR